VDTPLEDILKVLNRWKDSSTTVRVVFADVVDPSGRKPCEASFSLDGRVVLADPSGTIVFQGEKCTLELHVPKCSFSISSADAVKGNLPEDELRAARAEIELILRIEFSTKATCFINGLTRPN
jgi:hypothetical protein